MIRRVDLLQAELSQVDQWFARFYSPAFRQRMATPAMLLAIAVGLWTVQHVRVTIAENAAVFYQQQYEQLHADETKANVTNGNYQTLEAMLREIRSLQSSIVNRAQEIKDIINITREHRLAVTSLADLQATQGNATWQLQGMVVDQSRVESCHDVVALALPGFLKVKNIASAIPEHATRQSQGGNGQDSPACAFDLRLARFR